VFITFEGPEGAGKSTVLRAVADSLRQEGRAVLETREPGAGEVGREIRRLLLQGQELEPAAELFLFLADRAQHVRDIVRPALAEGTIVLCDRHADSTLVYQGYGRGLELALLRDLNRLATSGLRPGLTLLLDLPAEVGLARIAHPDRIDREPLEFHQRVRDGFLSEAQREPDRWVVLDASVEPEMVTDRALEEVRKRLTTAIGR